MSVNQTGRAEFSTQSERIKVWDVIGRSMVIHDLTSSSHEKRYALLPDNPKVKPTVLKPAAFDLVKSPK